MKANIRDIRKQKKQEKLWKMGKRKQKFAHIFLRTFIPFTVVVAIIGLLCTIVVREQYEYAKSSEFEAYVAELVNTLNARYSEWEEKYDEASEEQELGTREGLWKSCVHWTLCQFRFDEAFEHAVALYNANDKTLYCDNRETAFLIKKSRVSPEEPAQMYEFYECPKEYLEKVVSVVDKYNKQIEENDNEYESYWYAPQEVYVRGGQFLPGKVDIVKFRTGAGNEIIESYDLTPDNVEGWTRVEIDYMKERPDYYYPMIVGNSEDSISRKNLDALVAGTTSDAGEGGVHGSGFLNKGDVNFSYSDNVKIGNDFDKKLFVTASYNIFKDYGNKIYGSYIAAFLLTILISLAVSYRNYMVYKAQCRMDAYRRETTNAMAHDLKSPLAAVSGFAENLKNNIHTEKREYYVDAILENVQYMNYLIENILDLAKSENVDKAECTDIDLVALVNTQLKKQETIIEERNLQVVLSGAGKIYAHELSITQIVDNLLSNAVKYTRQDGSIFIKIMEKGFEIANEMEDEPGISVDELWKPFVKGDNSRGGRQGTGIGLTIVKNLAEAYGYKLELLTEEDTFVVRVKG